jgi:hypothetical protein
VLTSYCDEVIDERTDVMAAVMLVLREEQVKHKFISQGDEREGCN